MRDSPARDEFAEVPAEVLVASDAVADVKLVAVDSNVFYHLFNENDNEQSHIEQLLSHLAKRKYRLAIDSENKIGGEYETHVKPMLTKSDEQTFGLFYVRYWMHPDQHHEVPMDVQDTLMRAIKKVIYEQHENVDRAFVYVACSADCKLVTNDTVHIYGRRGELLRETKKLRGKNTAILKSSEAIGHF